MVTGAKPHDSDLHHGRDEALMSPKPWQQLSHHISRGHLLCIATTEPTCSAGSQLITHLWSTWNTKPSIPSFTRVHVSEQSGDRTGFSGAKRRSFSSRDQLLSRHGSNIDSKTSPRRPQQSEPRHLPLQLYGSFLIGYHCMSKRQKHFCDPKKLTKRQKRKKLKQFYKTHTWVRESEIESTSQNLNQYRYMLRESTLLLCHIYWFLSRI